MKKALKIVAMVLALVILSNCFTSCLILGGGKYPEGELGLVCVAFDLIVVGSIVFGIVMAITSINKPSLVGSSNPSSALAGTGMYGTQDNAAGDQVEQSSFAKAFNALPPTQIDALALKLQAVPEAEMLSFMEFYAMSPLAKSFFADELNALSEAELLQTVGYLNSLSETQFAGLLRTVQESE